MVRAGFANPEEQLVELLPRRAVQEFARGGVIYSPQQPSTNLYVLVAGRVKTSRTLDDGQTVCRLVCGRGLFGEPALIRAPIHMDTAVALEPTSLISWTGPEIERQVEREPRLGVVLCQCLAKQCRDLTERIESLVLYQTPERVMLALVGLARMAGTEMPDGTTRIKALTHQTLSEYIGTSREVVTFQLNRLRRLGMIQYSRQHMDFAVAKLEQAVRQGTGPSQGRSAVA